MKAHKRAGFTLIELLIVVVVIGILVTIAIPKFANTKERAYVAEMKTDLRNLASAEESYFVDHNVYATDKILLEFNESQQVTVNIDAGDSRGWRASTDHTNTPIICELYYGDAAGTRALQEGVISCS